MRLGKQLRRVGTVWLVVWFMAPVIGFVLCWGVLSGTAALADRGMSDVAPAASAGDMTGNMGIADV
ncbi:MAG: hypothetical protein QME71_02045 [Dehalococcoidia bacterium]|nr:hypothetical protein [Dehalococcoidia bacterium]